MASRNELEKILKGFLYLFFERECVRDGVKAEGERERAPSRLRAERAHVLTPDIMT